MTKKVVPNFPERNVISDDRSLISRPWAIWLRSLVDAVQANYNATIGAILHNSLPDLQGGAPDDYNHLTSEEKEQALTPAIIPDHDDLEGIQGEGYNHLSDEQVAQIGVSGAGGGIHTFPPPYTSNHNTIKNNQPQYMKYTHCGNTVIVTGMNVMQLFSVEHDRVTELGIYTITKQRLGSGTFASPANTIGPLPTYMRNATLDAPVELVAGESYYFAILNVTPNQSYPTIGLSILITSGFIDSNSGFIGNHTAALPETETGDNAQQTPFYIGAF
jgi:intracellular sulfur oxidation DsrE/DsrF family protein